MFDYLIVGAGFAGSVLAERLASQAGQKVLLIDRRPHIGGNAYDCYDDSGILIHKYGPHIFHTNAKEVFAYLSQFTLWRPYEHHVLTQVDGQLLPFPINLTTINQLYQLNLTSSQLTDFFAQRAIPKTLMRTAEDTIVSQIGYELYEKFFKNYTWKQWNRDASEMEAGVTGRIPVRTTLDDRYFSDTYQTMPLYGYTRLFENMLAHPNIKIMLNTNFDEIKDLLPYRHIIYTGPLDEFFQFRFGKLPYRSLNFAFQTIHIPIYQKAAVINYPNEHEYTRITEFKYLTGQEHQKTSIVYEYPRSDGDPYYPVHTSESVALAKKYKTLAETVPHLHFVGRLGTYQYYNMDQVVAQSLSLFRKLVQLPQHTMASAKESSNHQYLHVR